MVVVDSVGIINTVLVIISCCNNYYGFLCGTNIMSDIELLGMAGDINT